MFSFPPIPPLEGMHPIVVHFPLGLLLIAWIPMLLCVVDKKRRGKWMHTALTILVIGTLFTFAAVFTGEATEEIIGSTTQIIEDAVHEHEETAESARNYFIVTTVLFFFATIARKKLEASKKKPALIVIAILVALGYGLGTLTLANAGHQGGVLVHQYGIHAPITSVSPSALQSDQPSINHEDDDDDD